MLDLFRKYGHDEIDSARGYGGGSSEEYLGLLHWQDRGIVMDTKLSPRAMSSTGTAYTHKPEDLRRGLMDSLKALKAEKVRLLLVTSGRRLLI